MTATTRSGSPGVPLLPGEARESDVRDDAEHWVEVYEELITFILDVQGPNNDKVRVLRARLEYWRQRMDELGP